MELRIKKRYLKRSRRGMSPASFSARQPKGVGTTIHATIKLDPVLRKPKHRDLRNGIVKHELHEIRAWGNGHLHPHSHGRSKEPKLTRHIGGVSGFWREIERRERGV